MNDKQWINIAPTNSIKDGECKIINLPEQELEVAIFNISNKFFAIENRCPHQNLPIADGFIENNDITCPFHGAVFSLLTGEIKVNPGTNCDNLTIFPVKIEDNLIKINIL